MINYPREARKNRKVRRNSEDRNVHKKHRSAASRGERLFFVLATKSSCVLSIQDALYYIDWSCIACATLVDRRTLHFVTLSHDTSKISNSRPLSPFLGAVGRYPKSQWRIRCTKLHDLELGCGDCSVYPQSHTAIYSKPRGKRRSGGL